MLSNALCRKNYFSSRLRITNAAAPSIAHIPRSAIGSPLSPVWTAGAVVVVPFAVVVVVDVVVDVVVVVESLSLLFLSCWESVVVVVVVVESESLKL